MSCEGAPRFARPLPRPPRWRRVVRRGCFPNGLGEEEDVLRHEADGGLEGREGDGPDVPPVQQEAALGRLEQARDQVDQGALARAHLAQDGAAVLPRIVRDRSRRTQGFHGRDDLRRGVVRAVSEAAFRADAARLIRAVRLAAELGFTIDSDTEALIRRDSHLIAGVAGERVREELLRLLALPRAGQQLAYLDELGLLTALVPELARAKGVSQPVAHVWDVFEHSIQTVSAAGFLLREGDWEYGGEEVLEPVPWSDKLSQYFDQEVSSGSTRRSLLKLAALLHDIAKPQTKTVSEDGRARFLGHPQEGAATAVAILERLRFSTREIKLVELMVRYHLRPTQMTHEAFPTRRALYRYFRDTGEAGIAILFLSLADHLATRGPLLDREGWQEHAGIVAYVLANT